MKPPCCTRRGLPLVIEQVSATALGPADVLVRMRAAGLCHTDLEVIDGSLRYPMPIVLGHEAAGVIVEVGSAVREGPERRSRGAVLEPALRPLLLLRPRPADPVRGLSGQGPAGRPVRRPQQGASGGRQRAQASDVSRRLRRILHRAGAAGDRGAEGHPVRPGLPDRMRGDDRRGRGAQHRRISVRPTPPW